MANQKLIILRDKVSTGIPDAEIRADGTIWYLGNPIIDGKAAEADGIGRADIAAKIKAKNWDSLRPYMATMGLSSTGMEVLTAEEYDARTKAARASHLAEHPELAERQAIAALYARAEQADEALDDNNVERACRLRAEADRRLAAWREQYPAAAAEEDRKRLLDEATRLERLAGGALTYDMDGSISPAEQKRRHDAMMAEAAALRARAAK